jgi:hypothetical protein
MHYSRFARPIFILAIVLVVGDFELRRAIFGATQVENKQATDYGSKMIQSVKDARYDDAIAIGLAALRKRPNDASVYQQIAVVYLIRAEKDSAGRQQWLLEAASYIDKALNADFTNPINIRDLGSDLEKIGDLSTDDARCQDYRRALDLSKRAAKLLEGDHITLGGQAYPVDPVRKDFVVDGHTFHIEPLQRSNAKLFDSLTTKMISGKCG